MDAMMAQISNVFVSKIYRAELASGRKSKLVAELDTATRTISTDDGAGRDWCRRNGYPGYTSYASLDDLPGRDPTFAALTSLLDKHVAAFAGELDLDLGGRGLVLDSIWINILKPDGYHTAHIHPHSVVSGTLYIAVPKGAGAIKFEDPRLQMMMAAPPRKAKCAPENEMFLSISPKEGTLLLWESYLRHEVPVNHAKTNRISVSFNYRWG